MSDYQNAGVDPEKAKKLQAGVLKAGSIPQPIQSAWIGMKTALGLGDKKEKP